MGDCISTCRFASYEPDPRNEPPVGRSPGIDYGMAWMCRGRRSGSYAYTLTPKSEVGSCPGFERNPQPRSPA